MAKLKSFVYTIGETKVERSVINTEQLMPLDGILRVWFGEYEGTSAELQTEGLAVPMKKLLENVKSHSGIITMVSELGAGTIKVHEVK